MTTKKELTFMVSKTATSFLANGVINFTIKCSYLPGEISFQSQDKVKSYEDCAIPKGGKKLRELEYDARAKIVEYLLKPIKPEFFTEGRFLNYAIKYNKEWKTSGSIELDSIFVKIRSRVCDIPLHPTEVLFIDRIFYELIEELISINY